MEKEKQKEAVNFIIENYLNTPSWLFDDTIYAKTGLNYADVASKIVGNIVRRLLQDYRFISLLEAENALGSDNVYTVDQYFEDINAAIFSENYSNNKMSMYIRMLQKSYVDYLLNIMPILKKDAANSTVVVGYNPSVYDMGGLVLYQLQKLQKKLEKAKSTDMVTDAHYKYLNQLIKENIEL